MCVNMAVNEWIHVQTNGQMDDMYLQVPNSSILDLGKGQRSDKKHKAFLKDNIGQIKTLIIGYHSWEKTVPGTEVEVKTIQFYTKLYVLKLEPQANIYFKNKQRHKTDS